MQSRGCADELEIGQGNTSEHFTVRCCIAHGSGTAERNSAKFTRKTCLVPRWDELEGQGQFRRPACGLCLVKHLCSGSWDRYRRDAGRRRKFDPSLTEVSRTIWSRIALLSVHLNVKVSSLEL